MGYRMITETVTSVIMIAGLLYLAMLLEKYQGNKLVVILEICLTS